VLRIGGAAGITFDGVFGGLLGLSGEDGGIAVVDTVNDCGRNGFGGTWLRESFTFVHREENKELDTLFSVDSVDTDSLF
jgi:hypothetical protein